MGRGRVRTGPDLRQHVQLGERRALRRNPRQRPARRAGLGVRRGVDGLLARSRRRTDQRRRRPAARPRRDAGVFHLRGRTLHPRADRGRTAVVRRTLSAAGTGACFGLARPRWAARRSLARRGRQAPGDRTNFRRGAAQRQLLCRTWIRAQSARRDGLEPGRGLAAARQHPASFPPPHAQRALSPIPARRQRHGGQSPAPH